MVFQKFFVCIVAVLFSVLSTIALAVVDINTATSDQLAEQLKGVGQKKADRIVAYREQHGPFQSVMDLALVKGIGAKIIEKNLEKLTLNSETQAE